MNTEDALTWLAEIFEEPPGRLTADMSRDDVPAWDSLGTLTLIAGLDERFDIQLGEEEIDAMQRISDVLALLQRQGKLVDA
jgi:acyl carrier protein